MSRRYLAIVLLANIAATAAQSAERFNIGRSPTAEEIAGWDIDVRADGAGLPPGAGSVKQGQKVYAEQCSACHGANGEGKPADRLVGGMGSLCTGRPVKTVGSFWPYATTLFDFTRRAMPFQNPQSLTADDIYAVMAYVLYLNNIVPEDAVLILVVTTWQR
jgi:S-disulfanyl-L-cysteine oxidoreductase SoxD